MKCYNSSCDSSLKEKGTVKAALGQSFPIFSQKSFSKVAVFTKSKPTSPPNVDGFQYLGLQIGADMSPLTENGPPNSITVEPNIALLRVFSVTIPA